LVNAAITPATVLLVLNMLAPLFTSVVIEGYRLKSEPELALNELPTLNPADKVAV